MCPFVRQSVNICVNLNFDPNVQFPRTIEATMMILGISLHLGMTTHTTVPIFDIYLYFTDQRLCKCVNPSFDPYFQVHFSRTTNATVLILGKGLHLGMTTQTTVSIFDLYLYFTIHCMRKFKLNLYRFFVPRRRDLRVAYGLILEL